MPAGDETVGVYNASQVANLVRSLRLASELAEGRF